MSSQQEKSQFSERLKKALIDENHPISPTYLSREFNLRYDGQAVSVQSANNWLLAKAIPNQDKLSILSTWLNVSVQWLRFGDTEQRQLPPTPLVNTTELDYFLKFRDLKPSQKKIILNLVDEFLDHSAQ